jgi:hypothetical protein
LGGRDDLVDDEGDQFGLVSLHVVACGGGGDVDGVEAPCPFDLTGPPAVLGFRGVSAVASLARWRRGGP